MKKREFQDSMTYETFEKLAGKRIRELRESKGLTQKEIAGLANMTTKSLSRYETGNGVPTSYGLVMISNALEVDLSEFSFSSLQREINPVSQRMIDKLNSSKLSTKELETVEALLDWLEENKYKN